MPLARARVIKRSVKSVQIDEFGKFKLIDVKDDLLYLKISSKKLLSGKKFQLNMENGFNLLVDEKMFNSVKVNETVLYDFIKKKIISVISLKEGNYVYVIDGNYKGKLAKVIDFTNYNGLSRDLVSIEFEGSTHSTAKDYCFPVANKIEDLKRFN
ncbi:hypothetical protein EOM09_02535 [bacterium]|nr:hypothetical protein [bacterium]